MNSLTRRTIVAVTALSFLACGTYFAWAQWSIPAPIKAKVKTVKMPQGVAPSAALQAGQAVVTWSAQEIVPGVKMQKYVVAAHDTKDPPMPVVAHTMTASGSASESIVFTAAELAGGKWKFAIVPKFELWSGPEGKLSSSKLSFPAATPTAALAKAVTAVSDDGATPETTPTPTPAVSTSAPAPASTTASPEMTVDEPKPDPTTSAPDRSAEPEKTETPKVDPTPSGSASDPHPSLTAGVS